jgi:hypothetical protein
MLWFGGNRTVRAVFGPGLVLDVPVREYEDLPTGTERSLNTDAGLIALDGERRRPAAGGMVRVVEGPRILDLELALRAV